MITLPFPRVKLARSDDPTKKQIVIETPRLRLRGACETDVDGLNECFSDAVAMRYWSSLPHADLEKTSKWVETMIKSKRNGVADFVIELKSEPDAEASPGSKKHSCIGKVGMWEGNEIGFIIAQRYWKRGIATEAVTSILDFIFGIAILDVSTQTEISSLVRSVCGEGQGDDFKWPPEDIVADVDPRNNLSLNALHRLGFEVYATKEKTLQVGDEWVDSVYLCLTGKDWLERRKATKF